MAFNDSTVGPSSFKPQLKAETSPQQAYILKLLESAIWTLHCSACRSSNCPWDCLPGIPHDSPHRRHSGQPLAMPNYREHPNRDTCPTLMSCCYARRTRCPRPTKEPEFVTRPEIDIRHHVTQPQSWAIWMPVSEQERSNRVHVLV